MFSLNEKVELQQNSNDVLTVGELLVDLISADYDDEFSGNVYHKFFGGSPSNIAMNVKKLGIRSLVASAIGKDGLGNFLLHHLQQAGINTKCVQRVEDATSMVLVTKSQNSPTPIFYRGADYQLSYSPELEDALLNSSIMHFSCWAISRMPVRATVEKMIENANKNGKLVCFDPNYHPMLWQKGEDGVAYIKSIIGKVDIIKPSEDDAERLFGKDTHEHQIEKFLNLGVKLVIMTLGKDGAIVSNGTETMHFSTLATEVVDTTGAGDAFWSGFYSSIIEGYTVKESITSGLLVSAYKLKYTGAVVELPTLEEIKALLDSGGKEGWQ
jgi:sugar/nucleoside kinase (ribokinase family)